MASRLAERCRQRKSDRGVSFDPSDNPARPLNFRRQPLSERPHLFPPRFGIVTASRVLGVSTEQFSVDDLVDLRRREWSTGQVHRRTDDVRRPFEQDLAVKAAEPVVTPGRAAAG